MGISSVLGTAAFVPAGYGFRNLIINGAMQVAQRGTSASSKTTSGYYTADRWNADINTLGTWTQSVENDAPTGSGFRKSLKMLCTTADASPAAGDVGVIAQYFEGQNLQSIKKGTSSAERLTLTFWVKSNVTGTHVVELRDADNSRSVSASYSVSASATWEKKTIVFPADTTGAFDNDNAASLDVNFWLGAGSTYTSGTLATTWGSTTNANRAVGQTNVAAATNNYWQITGVQMEVGPIATAYEFKPYDVELAQCQRYYTQESAGIVYPATTTFSNSYCQRVALYPQMRATPTVTIYPSANFANTVGHVDWYNSSSGAGASSHSQENVTSSGFSIIKAGVATYTLGVFAYKADAEL